MKIRGQQVYTPQDRIERSSIPEPNSGCWIWLGAVTTNPAGHCYGRLTVGSRGADRRGVRAHRYSYEAHIGPIPDGLYICHRCDNTLCVNPDHLFAGTHQDNMDDRECKGRNSTPPSFKGSAAPWAKLTDDQVSAVRKSSLPSDAIAVIYGMSAGQIRAIRRCEHYPAPPEVKP